MKLPPIDLDILERDFAQLQRHGVPYGFGAKAEGGRDPRNGRKWNPRPTGKLSTPLSTIDNLDCSGAVRKLLYEASSGKLILPDGSQMQREYFENAAKDPKNGTHEIKSYLDINRYMTDERLIICFIRPGYNGCGPVGHVFLGLNCDRDRDAETMESYGGVGIASRPWDTRVLRREFYNGFELPTTRGGK